MSIPVNAKSQNIETEWDNFLEEEAASRDVLDVKRLYIDMAGDLVAGIMLSEIVFWHLRKLNGESKLRVKKKDEYWIASRRYEWWDRIRLSPKQADRALTILKQKKLIVTARFKFDGEVTTHIRINKPQFLEEKRKRMVCPPPNPHLPKGVRMVRKGIYRKEKRIQNSPE